MKQNKKPEANKEIKERAKAAGVALWRIAVKLDVSEFTLCRWLRVPLDEEKRASILAALSELEKESEGK